MKTPMRFAAACLLALATALPATADATGDLYKKGFTADFDRISKRLVDLAEATPAEKFAFRPVDGVRTISEVYMHVASANFFIASAVGVAPPEGFGPNLEKTVTEKAKVIDMLKQSQDAVRKALAQATDLSKEVQLFGSTHSTMGVFMIFAGHSHEHLGQSIAYARAAGITPPWSKGSDG
jgi:uncharacterized damage-inducible protein DinB